MKKSFNTTIRVIYGDTDAMGVAYHANYLRWFEIGRTEFLREIDYPYSEVEKLPVWLPLTHAHVEYVKPARYDDVLLINVSLTELGFVTIRLDYAITNQKTGELLVTGFTRHGITDDKLKPIKLKKIHPEFYAAMNAQLENSGESSFAGASGASGAAGKKE